MILFLAIESTSYPRDIMKVYYHQKKTIFRWKQSRYERTIFNSTNILIINWNYQKMKVLRNIKTTVNTVDEIQYYHIHMNGLLFLVGST